MCETIPYRRDLTEDDLERMKIPLRYWNVKFDEISDAEVGDDPALHC